MNNLTSDLGLIDTMDVSEDYTHINHAFIKLQRIDMYMPGKNDFKGPETFATLPDGREIRIYFTGEAQIIIHEKPTYE